VTAVHCNKGCGRSWPRHPSLEVTCPHCEAGPGHPCQRPSEHRTQVPHHDRYLAAYDAGHFGECPWNCCRPKERPLPKELTGQQLDILASATERGAA
jgi:hypothetical protein